MLATVWFDDNSRLLIVPKMRPKISQDIVIQKAPKILCLQGNSFIFCALAFSVAAYTRVKSEVQIFYRPFFP